MAADPRLAWAPDWAVPPGEILLEALRDRGMIQSELARRMARPLKCSVRSGPLPAVSRSCRSLTA